MNEFIPAPRGHLVVICGCMYSGKTEELIRRLRRAQIAKQPYRVFKPARDDRYGAFGLASHTGTSFPAVAIENSREIFEMVSPDTEVVAIDEAQFFDREIADICNQLAGRGIRVLVAGLDMDFRGEPFGPMPVLMAQAEVVVKLYAVCARCGQLATRTQRLSKGQPAHFGDPVVLVGGEKVYEARCRACHQIPGKPQD